MEKDSLEMKCCIERCRGEPTSLITVTNNSIQIAQYSPCQKHEAGIANAVMARYSPLGYLIAITDIPGRC